MEGHAPHDPADENRKLLPVVVPVVAPDFNLLSLHFAVDPGLWGRRRMTQGGGGPMEGEEGGTEA